jgi:LPXTG-motif cell wall-anchored protein
MRNGGKKMKTSYIFIMGILLVLLVVPAAAQDIIPNDTTKTMILHFHIKGTTITFLDARVIYGHSPDNLDIKDTFTGKMLGSDDRQIQKFGISDPRITWLDKGHLFTDDINFSVKVPATADLTGVGIYDTKTGKLLARADTTQAMKDFCTAHPQDPDCSSIPLWMIVVGAGVLVLFAGAGWYFLKKKKV